MLLFQKYYGVGDIWDYSIYKLVYNTCVIQKIKYINNDAYKVRIYKLLKNSVL